MERYTLIASAMKNPTLYGSSFSNVETTELADLIRDFILLHFKIKSFADETTPSQHANHDRFIALCCHLPNVTNCDNYMALRSVAQGILLNTCMEVVLTCSEIVL